MSDPFDHRPAGRGPRLADGPRRPRERSGIEDRDLRAVRACFGWAVDLTEADIQSACCRSEAESIDAADEDMTRRERGVVQSQGLDADFGSYPPGIADYRRDHWQIGLRTRLRTLGDAGHSRKVTLRIGASLPIR